MNSFYQPAPTLAFLDSLLTHAPIGCGFVSDQLCFITLNARLAEINDRSVPDHLGRTIAEALSPRSARRISPWLNGRWTAKKA